MRLLTFKGYLSKYVRQLSTDNTESLYKLAKEAENNPRLRAPLFLYALYSKKMEVLLHAARGQSFYAEYVSLTEKYSAEVMLHSLECQSPDLPTELRKVWTSYISIKDRNSTENQTKELMRKKIRQIQQEKQITNYRIYNCLCLNPGNVNAWIKTGKSDKVSLETARRILQYVQQ